MMYNSQGKKHFLTFLDQLRPRMPEFQPRPIRDEAQKFEL